MNSAVLLMGRTRRYGRAWQLAGSAIMDRSRTAQEESGETLGFNQAFLPYYVLTGVTLFCLLIGPVKAFLEQWQIGFAFPERVTGYGYVTPAVESYSPLAPLTYPGTFLIISCVVGYVYFKARGCIGPGGLGRILRRAVKKTVPSSVAVIGFIVTSKVMGCSGQVSVLAEGIVSVLGVGYAFFAPIVGLLGAFMTSSNMASNILFAEFQMTTAELLGLSVPGILGAQTAGGAIGSAICPGNIVLGTSTTGSYVESSAGIEAIAVVADAHAAQRNKQTCLAVRMQRSAETAVIAALFRLVAHDEVACLVFGNAANSRSGVQAVDDIAQDIHVVERECEVGAQVDQPSGACRVWSFSAYVVCQATYAVAYVCCHIRLLAPVLVVPFYGVVARRVARRVESELTVVQPHCACQGHGGEYRRVAREQNLGRSHEPRAPLRCGHERHEHSRIESARLHEQLFGLCVVLALHS